MINGGHVYAKVETGSGFQVIWVIRVTLLSGSSGPHLVYTISRFCIGSHVLIIVSGYDQSDKFGMLKGDDGSISPQNRSLSTAVLEGLSIQLEYFD